MRVLNGLLPHGLSVWPSGEVDPPEVRLDDAPAIAGSTRIDAIYARMRARELAA